MAIMKRGFYKARYERYTLENRSEEVIKDVFDKFTEYDTLLNTFPKEAKNPRQAFFGIKE